MNTHGTAADRARPAPAPATRMATGALMALTLVNLLNYLDRYIVSAVLPDLKRAGMQLSDLQLGSLMTAFLVVYMLAAPVFGAIGDRGSRTRPIAFGVALWSLATAGSGLARNYVQLLAARAAVGIGEASYGTIAPALIADYFPRERRGRAFAIFYMAIPVGSALGYVVGGLVSHAWGWHAAFFVAGVPGALLAVWMLRISDPPRGSQDAAAAPTHPGVPPAGTRLNLAGTLSIYLGLLRQSPYLLTVLGYAAYTFAVGGLAFWMPTFLQRVRGLSVSQATTGFGAIVVVTGFIGTFAGGWLGDYWLKHSRQAYLWMSGIVTLLALPLCVVALTAGARSLYYPALVGAELLLFMSTGPINSAIVNLVTPAQRASAVALSIFAIHVLGDVLSPPLIGVLSDRYSLAAAVLIVPLAVTVSGVLWLAAGWRSRVLHAL